MLELPLSCNEAVDQVSKVLLDAGFQVERSFDLQSARGALRAPELCPCPHHGTADCSCQYVVLLVSEGDDPPTSLIAHGQEHRTLFSIESSAEPSATELRLHALIDSLKLAA